jgi:hypothetical protein
MLLLDKLVAAKNDKCDKEKRGHFNEAEDKYHSNDLKYVYINNIYIMNTIILNCSEIYRTLETKP